MTPGANCFFCATTPQMVSGYSSDLTRFITTLPTATSPSRLERWDSKNIARARHSRSLAVWEVGPTDDVTTSSSRLLELQPDTASDSTAAVTAAGSRMDTLQTSSNGPRR